MNILVFIPLYLIDFVGVISKIIQIHYSLIKDKGFADDAPMIRKNTILIVKYGGGRVMQNIEQSLKTRETMKLSIKI